MKVDCFKCNVPLVKVDETHEAGRSIAVRGGYGRSDQVTHAIWRCPSCRKVRAVGAQA